MFTRARHREVVVAEAARCESLERRVLLSLAPAGGEFRANSFTTSEQVAASAAMDGDGDFVIAWQSSGQDGSAQGIYAQRYSRAGVPEGGEFRVNSTTPGPQGSPAVAMDADGDFVIVWDAFPTPGNPASDVFAQRYNAAGVPQGGEFRVNALTADRQSSAEIAMDAAGNFVVVWQSGPVIGTDGDIYARRFDAEGAPQGADFRVNTTTSGVQGQATVAIDGTREFVVAWVDNGGLDGAGEGIYAQRYSSSGVPQGGEFRVNTYTTSSQSGPSVGMDASGDFVIAWSSFGQDGPVDFGGIYAQRYNAAGVPQGAEFRVHTFTTGTQGNPSVSLDADGDFIVAWSSLFQDGDGYGVYAQAFNAAGVPQGSEFRVNTYTTGAQRVPSVARDHTGDVVFAWWSNGQDGAGYEVYAQRYAESADTAGPVAAGVFVNGARVLPYSTQQAPVQQIVVSFSENVTNATDVPNWLLTRDGADVSSDISSITFAHNAITNRYEAVLNLTTAQTSGNFLILARDTLHDAAGNSLDGDFDGTPGGSFALPFSLPAFGAQGDDFRVNTFTTNDQRDPAVAMDADGDFVLAWHSRDQDGSVLGVYAQRYTAEGIPQGTEFRVNTYTIDSQFLPSTAMDADGDFVVVWRSSGQDGSTSGIYAQRYNAAGVPQGTEFRVNTFTPFSESQPSVAMDANGNFVVTWHSVGQDNGYGVYARRFNAAGAPQGTEFRVNSYTTGVQFFASVAMNGSGDFVVAWESLEQDGSGSGVYAQRYNAAGAPQGSEFRVNSFTTDGQGGAAVAIDASGDFVVTWSSYQDGSLRGIYAQRYNAAGVPQGGEFKVNTFTTHSQELPSIAMDSDGNFAVAWLSRHDYGIYAQRYTAAGQPQGAEFRVNNSTVGARFSPAAASDADGTLVVAWDGTASEDPSGISARLFAEQHTPTVGALADAPDPIVTGNSLTLSASAATDDGSVTAVSFYRESNGVAGLQVGFEGDTLLAIDLTPSGGGVWTAIVSTAGLSAGDYTYWAQATDEAGLIGAPASTTNTVIPGLPAVTGSNFNFATLPQRLTFTFNQNVGASLGLDDIVVQQLPGGLTITPNGLSYDAGTNTATFTFNAALPDGRFRARLIAAGISGPGGTMPADHAFEFTFLRGDANGDGRVNLNDFNLLATNFGQSPRDFTQGDFNYDTVVNLSDFNLLASRFGTVLGPAERGASDASDTRVDDNEDDVRELLA